MDYSGISGKLFIVKYLWHLCQVSFTFSAVFFKEMITPPQCHVLVQLVPDYVTDYYEII